MKKYYAVFLIGIIFSGISLKAQVQHLCGNDTLILHLKNYQYGSIQWEESEDSVTWKPIDGAIDTIYKFYPDGNKYYHAAITFSVCSKIYSELFKVSMPVKANAGIDIETSISNITLSGNYPVGCSGQWNIINGSGGLLSDVLNPYSKFSGQIGQIYQLTWTLTNICGTSTDTMNVAMTQNVYRNNIVYVDNTDIILSDSAQRAAGNYIIKFSSPVPNVSDSSVLIFLTQDKLLLKVISVTTNSDTVSMTTTQGALSDFMVKGVVDLSPFNYNVDTLTKGIPSRLPTRQDLLNNIYTNGQVIFFNNNSSTSFARLIKSKGANDNTLSLQVNPIQGYNQNNVSLTISGNIDFTPNLVAYYKLGTGWLNIPYCLDTMIIELNNAKLHYSLTPELKLTGHTSLLNIEHEWPLYQQDIIVMAGPVPIWLSIEVGIDAVFTIGADGNVDVKLTYTYDRAYNAGTYYGQQKQTFTPFYNATEPKITINPVISGQATLDQSFQLGPEITMKLYNTLTGYIAFYALTERLNNACIDNQFNYWNTDLSLSSELVLGGYIDILGYHLFADDLKQSFTFDWYNDKLPYRIIKESGDMQKGNTGDSLTYPVRVKVQSEMGMPLPFVNVNFKPINGYVKDTIIKTDINGIAETNLTLDNTYGIQYLNANIKDCNLDIIDNVSFTSYNSDTICEHSTLDMTLNIDNINGIIMPIVKRGVIPYLYSTDATNYQSSLPSAKLTNGTTYKYYVKDANGCIQSKSYTHNTNTINPCQKSNITLNISINNSLKNIIVNTQGGKMPYQYAYGTPSSYTTSNSHTFDSTGVYLVYVKDANECEAYALVKIQQVLKSQIVKDIDGNIYDTVVIGSQTWMKENLKTTKYNDGTAITLVTDNTNWANITSPGYCWYNDSISYKSTYGALYNWYAVNTGKLCPTGWHVPTDSEWTTLTNYLGGESIAGGKLKEIGTTHWVYPNNGATNESGFIGLPGGFRSNNGAFGNVSYFGDWWSATDYLMTYSWYRNINFNFSNVYRNYEVGQYGLSVRCLRD